MGEPGNAEDAGHLQLGEKMTKDGRISAGIPSLSSLFLIQG